MNHKTIKRQIANNSCLLNRLIGNLSEEHLAPGYDMMESENVKEFLSDPDLINTVEGFLENNLNISATSKKTFMHRNTLLYRIEKINKILGLDIRNFEDAVTLKIVLLLNQKKNSKR